jgi:hypothetical protein
MAGRLMVAAIDLLQLKLFLAWCGQAKGQYGLVGFRSSYPGDDFVSELSIDYAVYEWMSP